MKVLVWILMVVVTVVSCGKDTKHGGAKRPEKTEDELRQVKDELRQVKDELQQVNKRVQKHDTQIEDRQNAIKKCEENDERLRVMKQENEDAIGRIFSLTYIGRSDIRLNSSQRARAAHALEVIQKKVICPKDEEVEKIQKAIDEIKNVLDEYTQQGLAQPEIEPVVYTTRDDAGTLKCYLCDSYDRAKCHEKLQSEGLEETSCLLGR